MKLFRGCVAVTASCLISVSSFAQQAVVEPSAPTAAAPLVVGPAVASQPFLPQNTEVLLSLNEELSTKKNREGDTFHLTVAYDVIMNGYVIIPKGTRATGEVTWRTGKGAFGKSGKMEIEIKYLDLGGRRIPLVGKFRQEGEGNTAATVGVAIAAGVFAGFVTGRSGVVPRGREFMVYTRDDLPVAFAAPPPQAPVMAFPVAAQSVTPPPGTSAAPTIPYPAEQVPAPPASVPSETAQAPPPPQQQPAMDPAADPAPVP